MTKDTSGISASSDHKIPLAVFAAALAAVEPAAAVRRQVRREGDALRVADRVYDLRRYRNVYVVGGGKAAVPMAAAIQEILGDRTTAGLVNTRRGQAPPPDPTRVRERVGPVPDRGDGPVVALAIPHSRIAVIQAGHPIPDEAGQAGAAAMAELLTGATADDLVICLISGGGSALMALPAEGITLADKQAVTGALLASGATINEVNAVRKHLSRSKGGGFALLAYPAEVITLILSDVVGSPLDVIASGPTVPDASTFADACAVLSRYGLWDRVPSTVRRRLDEGRAGQLAETPKPGHPAFARTFNLVVADNRVAARAAVAEAERLGFHAMLLSTSVEGEAREVGKVFAALAREIAETNGPLPRPACLVAGGETTVTLHGAGRGGRNQEMALSAAIKMAGLERVALLCGATDGSDGPTDAAGAVVDSTTAARARSLGMEPAAFLAENDSYSFFQRLGDLIITGPTNTNVNDLTMVFAF